METERVQNIEDIVLSGLDTNSHHGCHEVGKTNYGVVRENLGMHLLLVSNGGVPTSMRHVGGMCFADVHPVILKVVKQRVLLTAPNAGLHLESSCN